MRDKALSDRARRSVQHIRDEARALNRLVANLLDISKSAEAQLVPQLSEVELSALSAEVLGVLELRAQTKGVRLVSEDEPVTIRADPDLMRRVLENLVENAIRHTPEETTVRVSIRNTGNAVELRVADEGAGVPVNAREMIFERYFQVEGRQAGVRMGQGLGLAFCKVSVEAHGGSICVEDASPGAVFCVRVPHAD
jgi:K+-sensing histidine kinase KdpD